jgi:hypothetical protein
MNVFIKKICNDYIFLACHDKCIDQNKLRAELLAHLISMPIQLIYLRIEQFEWLLHLIEYVRTC